MARVGIASEWIGQNVGGPERYATELVEGVLAEDSPYEYSLFVPPSGRRFLERLPRERFRAQVTAADSRWHFVPLGLPWKLRAHPVDLLHATFSFAPWCPADKVVLTVHDVTADVYPEFFPPLVGLRVRFLLRHGLERACRVLVPTEATRRELLEHYRVEEEKIRVIPYGVEQAFASAEPDDEGPGDDPPGEFILYVGRFHVRKNLERLLEAFARLAPRYRDVTLLLVGRDFWDRRHVLETVARLGLGKQVSCPGHLSDRALERLYRRARVFLYPSLHEGFGLPPLEAMARGLPVLASRVSAMPEVLGDAALLVDPFDVDDIAHGIDRLLSDDSLCRELAERGRRRARAFTWQATARATVAVYHEVLENGNGRPKPPASVRDRGEGR